VRSLIVEAPGARENRGLKSAQSNGGLADATDFLCQYGAHGRTRCCCTAELERLGERSPVLSAHLDAATAHLLDLIREFDARAGWNTGFRRCRVAVVAVGSTEPARERVRVARALGTLPAALAQALARATVVCESAGADARCDPETQERLSRWPGGTPSTSSHVRGWRRVDRQAEAREAARRHTSRALHVYQDEDGMVVFRGRLAPEVGAVLIRPDGGPRSAVSKSALPKNVPAGNAWRDVSAEPPTMPSSRRTRWRSSPEKNPRSTTG